MDVGVKAPELEYVGTYDAMLKPPLEVHGPFGVRQLMEVVGGEFRGAATGCSWVPAGGDGSTFAPRFGWRTARSSTSIGVLEMNEAVGSALESGAATNFEDHYFRTTPRFETSDPKYAWLQQSVFIGQGRVIEGLGVQYNVFQVK